MTDCKYDGREGACKRAATQWLVGPNGWVMLGFPLCAEHGGLEKARHEDATLMPWTLTEITAAPPLQEQSMAWGTACMYGYGDCWRPRTHGINKPDGNHYGDLALCQDHAIELAARWSAFRGEQWTVCELPELDPSDLLFDLLPKIPRLELLCPI